MGKKPALYSLRPTENCFFRHGNLVLPALFFRPLSRFASWSHINYRRIGGSVSRNAPSVHHQKTQGRGQAVEHVHQAVERRHALRQAKGRHRAANPRRPEEAPWETPQPEESAGRRRRTPPQSTTRRCSGGGRRWSTCIKRWNVATLSARRRGDTARPTSTQPEESAGRLPGWIKIPSRPGTCIRRGSRAPQAADHRRGERAKRGETTSSRSGYSPAGMAGCAPDAGGSSVAMGDCPLSAGKNNTPSVPPGRWAVRRKRISVDIWKKNDEVNEKQAFRTPSVGIGQDLSRGIRRSAAASPRTAGVRNPNGRSQRRSTRRHGNLTAASRRTAGARNPNRRNRRRPTRRHGRPTAEAHTRRGDPLSVVPPRWQSYLPVARCRRTRRIRQSAVCALRSASAA